MVLYKMGFVENFINKIYVEREFIMKVVFFFSSLFGIVTVISRIFFIPTNLKEIFITREYVITLIMLYSLNEWARATRNK